LIRLVLFTLYFLLSPAAANAQLKCVVDADGNCIAKGKLKTYSQKTSFGSRFDVQVRIDKWQFFSIDGTKVAEGSYREKDQASFKDGEWLFYSADSRLLFSRWYDMGTISRTVFHDTGCYAYESEEICIQSDSLGALTITERKGTISFSYKGMFKSEITGEPYQAFLKSRSQAASQQAFSIAGNTYRAESDSSIILKYPFTRVTLNIRPWAAESPQNLITNGNFEMGSNRMAEVHASQIQQNNERFAKFWGSANETPDIYKLNGNCYGGFRVMGVNFEVLRNELSRPLEADKTYCMQFKLKLKQENSYAFNGVSVVCSNSSRPFRNSREGIEQGVMIQTHPEVVLGCREQWMIISGSFVAEGGEKYIYISNFTSNDSLKLFKIDSTAGDYVDEIYYYIDDVVLIEETSSYKCPCNTSRCVLQLEPLADTAVPPEDDIFINPKVGQKIILRNIQFETAKWTLLDESFETLDSLVELMLRFPAMKVEISGHTDNKGNKRANETLSLNRANAVIRFLTDNGIEAERLESKGYGQDLPIDSNETEEGRLNNRRVEFVILEL
jgi:outer membrane protein OmpA-like peptidoglycan-associated protein